MTYTALLKLPNSKLLRYVALPLAVAATVLAVGVRLPLEQYPVSAPDPRPLVIDDINIVDLQAGVIVPGQTIVIMGDSLAHVGAPVGAPVPANARRISGAGKYAMPGLWDMHVHTVSLSPQLHFPLLLANGVTSIRDMGDGCSFTGKLNCQPDGVAWRARTEQGTLLAPRLLPGASYHVEKSEAGLVVALAARGDRMLKLQLDNNVDPTVFHTLLQQAKAAGMEAVGHLPYTVDLLDPQLGSLRSIEHDDSLPAQCVSRTTRFDGSNSAKLLLVKQLDEPRCDAVLKVLATRGIGYVPTHVASSGQDWRLLSGDYRRDAHVRYVALPQRLLWRGYAALTIAGTGVNESPSVEAWHHNALKITARAHASGVAVMAGSDSIDAYVTHGFGLHDELAQLVSAGLSPLQALRAATAVPAAHAGLGGKFGSVQQGRVADIVLLNNNPLDRIAHAHDIDSVVYNGKLYERKDLDAMLAFVEKQAASYSLNSKFLWAMIKP